MNIGIIGAGNIGQAIATQMLRAGHTVLLANSRGPETLAATVDGLGIGADAVTIEKAAEQEVVVVAVPGPHRRRRRRAARLGQPHRRRRQQRPSSPRLQADLGGRTFSVVFAGLFPRRPRGQDREHPARQGAGRGSGQARRQARSLHLRRRQRSEGNRQRPLRPCRIPHDRRRRPRDRRGNSTSSQPAHWPAHSSRPTDPSLRPRRGPGGHLPAYPIHPYSTPTGSTPRPREAQ